MHRPCSAGGHRASSSRAGREEESIYSIDAYNIPPTPKVRTYDIVPPLDQAPTRTGAGAGAAAARLKNHSDSSQIANALNPVMGPRDAARRKGQTPFNHARSNVAAVREQSRLNALRKMAGAEAFAVGRPKLGPTTGLRLPTRSPSALSASGRPSPHHEHDADEDGRDFLRENRMNACATAPRQQYAAKDDDGHKYLTKKDYGRVPEYIVDRKIEMAERMEQEQRDKDAARIPPGMRLMSEEERLETLSILAHNREDIEKSLQALPLRIETTGQIRRKGELELRLKEIDEAHKIFSRPKVVVHV